jgi:hypothetical protein
MCDIGKVLKLRTGNAAQFFARRFKDILLEEHDSPSELIKQKWEIVEEFGPETKNIRGKLFEHLIAAILYREGITPFFTEVKLAFVPNMTFDIVLYSREKQVISLSLKTSLRERWKQADLEALALNNVHRASQNYLITLEENDFDAVKKKIGWGLDQMVHAMNTEFDDLIKDLKNQEYERPGSVQIFLSHGTEVGPLPND